MPTTQTATSRQETDADLLPDIDTLVDIVCERVCPIREEADADLLPDIDIIVDAVCERVYPSRTVHAAPAEGARREWMEDGWSEKRYREAVAAHGEAAARGGAGGAMGEVIRGMIADTGALSPEAKTLYAAGYSLGLAAAGQELIWHGTTCRLEYSAATDQWALIPDDALDESAYIPLAADHDLSQLVCRAHGGARRPREVDVVTHASGDGHPPADLLDRVRAGAKSRPQTSVPERRALARWVNETLKAAGWQIRYPGTDRRSSVIVSDSGKGNSYFVLSYRENNQEVRSGRHKDVCDLLEVVDLIPAAAIRQSWGQHIRSQRAETGQGRDRS